LDDFIGWFGIVMPTRNFYQGFYLSERHRAPAVAAMGKFRQMADCLKQVITIAPLPGIREADQRLLGALASTALEAVMITSPSVLMLGTCISEVIGTNYFYITGGHTTSSVTVTRLPVHTTAMARTTFSRLPEIRAINERRQETS
jgi:hypothetical protein